MNLYICRCCVLDYWYELHMVFGIWYDMTIFHKATQCPIQLSRKHQGQPLFRLLWDQKLTCFQGGFWGSRWSTTLTSITTTKCGWINRISRRIPLLQGKKVHSDHEFYIILPCAIKHPRVMLFRNLWISRRQPLAWRIYRCAAAEGAETEVSMGKSFANGGCSLAMLNDGGTMKKHETCMGI